MATDRVSYSKSIFIVFIILALNVIISVYIHQSFRQTILIAPKSEEDKKLPEVFSAVIYKSGYENGPLLQKCEEFQNYADYHGYSSSVCRSGLGNELGLLAFGFAVHLQFGIKLMLSTRQQEILSPVFNVSRLCRNNDGSAFCMSLPKGTPFDLR